MTSVLTKMGSIAVTAAMATTAKIPYDSHIAGFIHVPTGSSITTLTWWAAPSVDGTYTAAHSQAGVAVAQTVAGGKSYALPAELAGAAALKVVGDAAGEIDIVMKS